MKNQTGFTIYELLIVLIIIGLTMAVGLPSLADLTQNNRTAGQVNDMVTSIIAARSEALSRGRQVGLVPIGGDWAAGWQIMVDVNRDNDFDDAGDVMVRRYPAVEKATLAVSGADIVFQPTGWPVVPRVVTILADNCRGENLRQISMSTTGILTPTKMSCP